MLTEISVVEVGFCMLDANIFMAVEGACRHKEEAYPSLVQTHALVEHASHKRKHGYTLPYLTIA